MIDAANYILPFEVDGDEITNVSTIYANAARAERAEKEKNNGGSQSQKESYDRVKLDRIEAIRKRKEER